MLEGPVGRLLGVRFGLLPVDQAGEPLTTLRVKKLFMENKSELAEAAVEDMRKLDLVDSDDNLTREALMFLRMELRQG